ncbi:tryptophan--tRNA ligase [Orientia tsutsugamushi]|uniref:Tryptophan--tRNA ligase n=1 Tax=Orientia tsutsugamushi TaxID=784 RepID=A0A2U3R8P2_ORITS|nr:tryptophan--tRNA ligase [Orientia tsutsugamushi]KJV72995.1 tryptophan--tRNA ligase [Orientia tsutsugamushi str. UT76]SPR09587.1 tryptophan--tRNA ligase [Orientia tsutsugamushi]
MSKRILSGIQVTGKQHLGNYLGSIQKWVQMQSKFQSIFFLANLHSITTSQESLKLSESIFSSACMLLACGINPKQSIIFLQSDVKEHSELAWILNCVTPLGQLKRMTQFKDKATKCSSNNINLGLLAYPVLMAADVLLYQADLVPVGADQKQHLELVRDIVKIIHHKFNDDTIFKLPELFIDHTAGKIMSLKDGRKKMSKSDISDFSRINLTDSQDIIFRKLQKAKTDCYTQITYDPTGRPEISNLINIFAALSNKTTNDIVKEYEYAELTKLKKDLAMLIIDCLNPILKEYNNYMNNLDYVNQVLITGANQARIIAEKTITKVKQKFGLQILST